MDNREGLYEMESLSEDETRDFLEKRWNIESSRLVMISRRRRLLPPFSALHEGIFV